MQFDYCERYIRRDYTSKPQHLRLLDEVTKHPRVVRARRENGFPETETEEIRKFPIDYVYFRPWLLPQVNAFLCSCIFYFIIVILSLLLFFVIIILLLHLIFLLYIYLFIYFYDLSRFLARHRCARLPRIPRLHRLRPIWQPSCRLRVDDAGCVHHIRGRASWMAWCRHCVLHALSSQSDYPSIFFI